MPRDGGLPLYSEVLSSKSRLEALCAEQVLLTMACLGCHLVPSFPRGTPGFSTLLTVSGYQHSGIPTGKESQNS